MVRYVGLGMLTAAVSFAGSFTGPTSVYYLSDSTAMYKVQGLTLLASWAVAGTAGADLPIAVDTQIRTTGLGTQYTNNGYAGGALDIWDGATDTFHDYSVSTVCDNCTVPSSVIRTDLDWSNPVVLFGLGSGYDSLGVTYDPTTLISQSITGLTDIGALALDPADQLGASGAIVGLNSTTLWTGEMIEFSGSSAPEPETWPLWMVGIAAIAIWRRYRRVWN